MFSGIEDPAQTPASGAVSSSHDAKKPLVAVVDDEADVGKAFRRLLRSGGYEADVFCSGQEFLQSLQARQPNCLILDLHLPGLTGLDVLRHLTAAEAHFGVIMITGRDEPGLEARLLGAGAAALLLKPVDDVELLGKVARLTSDQRQE